MFSTLNMNSKIVEKLFFSFKEEDFVYFSGQIEARMYVFKLNKNFDGTVEFIESLPTLSGRLLQEQIYVANILEKDIIVNS